MALLESEELQARLGSRGTSGVILFEGLRLYDEVDSINFIINLMLPMLPTYAQVDLKAFCWRTPGSLSSPFNEPDAC
jgi:hypothetical protein